jgi:hypothetical protein
MARQQQLNVDDRKKIKAIEDMAEEYVKARNSRMKILKTEVELKGKLSDLMKAHKLKKYAYDGEDVGPEGETVEVQRLIEIEKAEEKLKVKNNKAESEEEDEEKEGEEGEA